MRVSVIVPVRDDAQRLALCLAAMWAQTLPAPSYEVVVVDDGSSDNVEAAVGAYPGMRLLRQRPAGSYAARNRGVRNTSAPVLAFTDADCTPAPDWLERALAVLDAHPGINVVAGSVEVIVPRDSRQGAVALHDALTAFPQRRFVERYGFGATANLVVRRAVFDHVGLFDATLQSGGDAQWGERASAAGHCVVYREDVRVRHPARRKIRELTEKTTRTTRGVEQIAEARGNPDPLPRAVGERLLAPWRELPQLLNDPRLARPGDRARFFGVAVFHATLVAAETVRYRAAQRLRRTRRT